MQSIFNYATAGMCALVLFLGFMSFVPGNRYEAHVSSNTLTANPQDWDVQELIDSQGNKVPSNEWETILQSGNVIPIPVASLELRKRYSSSERGL
jgi:hypothetical protein